MTNITWCHQTDFEDLIGSKVQPTQVVLDIDCGTHVQAFFQPQLLHICCEARPEALHVLQNRLLSNPQAMIMPCSGGDLLTTMPDKSVDTLFVHSQHRSQTHEESASFLAQYERVARIQILVLEGADTLDTEDSEPSDPRTASWAFQDFDSSWEIIAVGEETAEMSLPADFCAIKNFRLQPKRDLTRKLALLSYNFPPSNSGQAILLHHLFNDVNEAHFCMISSKDHHARTFPNNLLPHTTDGLRARFYHIGAQPFYLNWNLLHSSTML